jgi:mannose-6-phosphate isomerase-like protein (cupin superfamily)
MEHTSRRSVMAMGVTAAATPFFLSAIPVVAKEYGPNEGKELGPGIRMVELGEMPSNIKSYKTIKVVDVIFQPGAVDKTVMETDMVCHITSGEFKVVKNGKEFTVKQDEVYTCGKGDSDTTTNTSKVVGVHRIAILVPA